MPVWEPAIVDVLFFNAFVIAFPAAVLVLFFLKDRFLPVHPADAPRMSATTLHLSFKTATWRRKVCLSSLAIASWLLAVALIAMLILLNKEFRIASREHVMLGRILYAVFTFFFLFTAYLNWYAGCQTLRNRWGRGLAISMSTIFGLQLFAFAMSTVIKWHG